MVAAEICRRLDGLPLAIELAAARLQAMDLTEVAAGLDHRFRLLTSGMRTAPRQRSLSAAVAWSYDLLDGDLAASVRLVRRVLRTVFGGGRWDQRRRTRGRVDAFITLVERSLVQRTADNRYVLLETLKEFALERLAESGRIEDLRKRHAARALEMARRCTRRASRPIRPRPSAQLDALLIELRGRAPVPRGDG